VALGSFAEIHEIHRQAVSLRLSHSTFIQFKPLGFDRKLGTCTRQEAPVAAPDFKHRAACLQVLERDVVLPFLPEIIPLESLQPGVNARRPSEAGGDKESEPAPGAFLQGD
jgi:hypothetical protein